jgi:hypothetical protein
MHCPRGFQARELRRRAGIEELIVSEDDILDGIALSIAL